MSTVTYTLEEIVSRFEQKMDRQFAEINQKMDRQFEKVDEQFTEVNQKIDKQAKENDEQFKKIGDRFTKVEIGQTALSREIKTLEVKLIGEIKTLDAKVDGIDKRVDNQEFLNRGVSLTVIAALIGMVIKILDIVPKG